MKSKFALSRFNIVFLSITALIFLLLFLVSKDKSPYATGFMLGKLVNCLLWPTLVAWVVWLLSKKTQGAGTTAFNIVLFLVLIGQIVPSEKERKLQEKAEELKNLQEGFRDNIGKTDDPAKRSAAIEDFGKSVEKNFDETVKASSGQQQQLFLVLKQFVSESLKVTGDWAQAYAAVEAPRILDFSLLKNEGEYEFQIKTVTAYIEQSKAYQAYFSQMVPELKKRISVFGADPEAQGVIEGATRKHEQQKPIFEPLIAAHIAYGETILEILNLLRDHQDEWKFEKGKIVIEQDAVLEKYRGLLESLSTNEGIINDLSPKILKTM